MKDKTLIRLAYNSFTVIKWIFALLFVFIVFYRFFEPVPMFLFGIFIFVSGLFVGYSVAYYSIKYLQNKG